MYYRTNYILGIDRCLLQNLAVQDARHNMYHYLVLGYLCDAAPDAHLCYHGENQLFPHQDSDTPVWD